MDLRLSVLCVLPLALSCAEQAVERDDTDALPTREHVVLGSTLGSSEQQPLDESKYFDERSLVGPHGSGHASRLAVP